MSTANPDFTKMIKITEDFYMYDDEDSFLGKGAFGQVRKGYSKLMKKIIAVKHIYIEQNYERQIDVLKTLSSLIHQNIMGFYGYQLRKQDVYMFIEYCPGGILTQKIKDGLSELQVLKYFRQMVEGMCYINAKKKMHRDLKPDNILIGIQNQVKISDFGLARQASQNVMVTGKKGTPLYAAPQVYLADEHYTDYSQKCDVWGGGVILYEMLTGQKLFSGVLKAAQPFFELKNEWQRYRRGVKRVKYDEPIHPLWQYFTNIMITYDPKKRPSFAEVLQILKKAYTKMEKQIENKNYINKSNIKLLKLENYLNFDSQKYEILLKIADKYSSIDIALKESVNYYVSFLSICKYLTHMKKVIRDLKNKNFSLPDFDEDLVENQIKDFQIVLCMDKYRNCLETSYTFYSDLLKNTIVQKLLSVYLKRAQDETFFAGIKDAGELINDVKEGMFNGENSYSSKLKQVVSNSHLVLTESKLSECNEQSVRHYLTILLASNLNKHFPDDKYEKENFVKQNFEKVLFGSKKQLIAKRTIL